MSTAKGDKITLDRSVYESLVRRAQSKFVPYDEKKPVPQMSVLVPRSELDHLISIALQYENLRRNLLNGGVAQEQLDLLSQRHDNGQYPQDSNEDGGALLYSGQSSPTRASSSLSAAAAAAEFTASSGTAPPVQHHSARKTGTDIFSGGSSSWSESDLDKEDCAASDSGTSFITQPSLPQSLKHGVHRTGHGYDEGGDYAHDGLKSPGSNTSGASRQDQPQQSPQEHSVLRTVQIFNLPDGTTHADVTAVVRGGMLLDVHLRPFERSVLVSFLHDEDAARFLQHSRKHDLYMKNKRVDVKWADRQFYLRGHIANKMAAGACRNLIIRRCDARHTAKQVYDDLDHIHNIVVIGIGFAGNDCFISLNSVHNAMFARTCLMSRLRYKSCRVEWGFDECSLPLSEPQLPKPLPVQPTSPKKAPTNRFQALKLDGDGEDEDSDDTECP